MKTQILALLLISTVLSDPYVTNCITDVRGLVADIAALSADSLDIPAVVKVGENAVQAVKDCSAAIRSLTSVACKSDVQDFINTGEVAAQTLRNSPRTAFNDALNLATKGKAMISACGE